MRYSSMSSERGAQADNPSMWPSGQQEFLHSPARILQRYQFQHPQWIDPRSLQQWPSRPSSYLNNPQSMGFPIYPVADPNLPWYSQVYPEEMMWAAQGEPPSSWKPNQGVTKSQPKESSQQGEEESKQTQNTCASTSPGGPLVSWRDLDARTWLGEPLGFSANSSQAPPTEEDQEEELE